MITLNGAGDKPASLWFTPFRYRMYNSRMVARRPDPAILPIALAGGIVALWLAGCRPIPATPTPTPATPTATPAPTPTVTPTPSPTPEPLAARVNGQPIRLADYQAELARCRAALASATTPSDPCPAQTLQALIDRALILQASQEAGISVSDAQVEDEVRATLEAAGGEAEFSAWLEQTGWTPATLRAALRSELLAQALIERTIGPVEAAEQVHARHILVATEAEARDLLSRLADGADFAELAAAYSLDATTQARGGDLGWFARGQLLAPAVEAAAFALRPGEIGDIIRSELGYHIVQTLERDPGRPLSPDQQAAFYRQALEHWLAEQRAGAHIERFIDTDTGS